METWAGFTVKSRKLRKTLSLIFVDDFPFTWNNSLTGVPKELIKNIYIR